MSASFQLTCKAFSSWIFFYGRVVLCLGLLFEKHVRVAIYHLSFHSFMILTVPTLTWNRDCTALLYKLGIRFHKTNTSWVRWSILMNLLLKPDLTKNKHIILFSTKKCYISSILLRHWSVTLPSHFVLSRCIEFRTRTSHKLTFCQEQFPVKWQIGPVTNKTGH